MYVRRLAIAGAMMSVAGMLLLLAPKNPPPVVVAAVKECRPVQDVIDKNKDLVFLDMVWPVYGTSHLGGDRGRLLFERPAFVLRDYIDGLKYDYILAQMTTSGPVYFFFLEGCVVKATRIDGGDYDI